MDRWAEYKGQVEKALETGDFVEALSHLDAFIASTTFEDLQDCKLLLDHALKVPDGLQEVDFLLNHLRYNSDKNSKDVPALHYLACFPYTQKDIARLDKLINIFTDFGYDINTKTNNFLTRRMNPSGITALIASISMENPILMECLLRNGAGTNIRDSQGFSPCHWAAAFGDLRCFEKLIQFGGPSLLATTSIENDLRNGVHPILHTVARYGQTEIMSYLLSNAEEFGLDVNEMATYKNYRSFEDDRYTLETYTPLGIAIFCREIPVVQLLLKHSGVKLTGFKELHFCFELGYTDIALILLEHFSDEELVSDKIGGRWALHSVQAAAFYKEPHAEFTKKLILEYVRKGWDVNSLGTSPIRRKIKLAGVWMTQVARVYVKLTKYTLLHLACLREGREEIIKALVEEAGADVNCKTEGDMEMTPLHILLTLRQWKSAEILIENGTGMNIRGKFKDFQFTRFMRRNLTTGALEYLNPCPNSLEMLLRLGCEEGLPLLNKVLARTDVVWDGVNEFLLSLEGGNPVYISKVLQHCGKTISKKELSWATFLPYTYAMHPETVSTLACLINILRRQDWTLQSFVDVPALANLIKLLVTLGYDVNLSRHRLIVDHLLTIDVWQDSSNLLLRTLLQVDHFRLNLPKESRGLNPVERVLLLWSDRCDSNSLNCFEDKTFPPPCVETVKLLISHGLDVTGMVIDNGITYHRGYDTIFKLLYCAGAKFSNTFFSSRHICRRSRPQTKAIFAQEIADVKRWKDEFDQITGSSLKHMCRLSVRKTLKCVEDLKMLDEIPNCLRDYVLCQAFH